jgi:hypothetical protein
MEVSFQLKLDHFASKFAGRVFISLLLLRLKVKDEKKRLKVQQ